MPLTDKTLDALRDRVRGRLSDKRFAHTAGVEQSVKQLAGILLPRCTDELRVAALLHDITKEYSSEEHMALLHKHGMILSENDRHAPALLHSMTAPLVIQRDFPDFATEAVLSAVACHTTGKVGMSIFDKIVFVSDYIEEGRTYTACVAVRNRLFDMLSDGETPPLHALNAAVVAAMDNTIVSLIGRGAVVSEQTFLARNALVAENFRG